MKDVLKELNDQELNTMVSILEEHLPAAANACLVLGLITFEPQSDSSLTAQYFSRPVPITDFPKEVSHEALKNISSALELYKKNEGRYSIVYYRR